VLADETANAWNTALDMMNEAEHGDDSACLLVTDSESFAQEVAKALPKVLEALPEQRRNYCEAGFSTFGGIMICKTMDAAIDFCNEYAVEHLLIKTRAPEQILPRITNAGEILLGETTPSVLGNFGIGINAVLPTGGAARTHSCTSVWSFLKRSSLSYVTAAGYQSLKKPVETLAEYEGFVGHAHVTQKRDETAFRPINIAVSKK
jgi:histidinol dehydrogenase